MIESETIVKMIPYQFEWERNDVYKYMAEKHFISPFVVILMTTEMLKIADGR